MESEATITNDSAPVDSAPDSGADIGSTMEQVYDAHHESDDTQSATDIGSNEWNADHTVTDQTPEQTYSPSDQLGVQMPLAWGKSQEALWNGLTPDAQRYIADRELQAQRRLSELGHLAKHGDVGQAFESYKAQGVVPLGEDGQPLSAPQVLESALAFDQQLRQSPAEAITALANAHGVDLAGLAGVQSNTGYSPEIMQVATQLTEALQRDPAAAIAALARQYGVPDHSSAYERAQAELQQRLDQQQQHQHAARYQWVASELEKFTTGKDYWSTVEDEVIRQVAVVRDMDPTRLQSDPLSVLKEAEQRALRIKGIDPDAKTKATEAKKKADQAKRLASMNVGKSSLGRAVSTGQSWEDTMADAYDRVVGYRR